MKAFCGKSVLWLGLLLFPAGSFFSLLSLALSCVDGERGEDALVEHWFALEYALLLFCAVLMLALSCPLALFHCNNPTAWRAACARRLVRCLSDKSDVGCCGAAMIARPLRDVVLHPFFGLALVASRVAFCSNRKEKKGREMRLHSVISPNVPESFLHIGFRVYPDYNPIDLQWSGSGVPKHSLAFAHKALLPKDCVGQHGFLHGGDFVCHSGVVGQQFSASSEDPPSHLWRSLV